MCPCRNGSGIDGVARPPRKLPAIFPSLCSYFAFAQKRIERSVVRYGIYSQYANCISAFSTFGLARNARRPVSNRVKSDIDFTSENCLCNEELRNPPTSSCMEMTLGHRDFPSSFSEICTHPNFRNVLVETTCAKRQPHSGEEAVTSDCLGKRFNAQIVPTVYDGRQKRVWEDGCTSDVIWLTLGASKTASTTSSHLHCVVDKRLTMVRQLSSDRIFSLS